jgi:hypothetical protein
LQALQETIKKCKRKSPESRDDLIYALEGFAAWIKDILGKLGKADQADKAEKLSASNS